MSLFNELKRRNVFRVAIAYLVAAWLLIQLADILVPMLTLPEWVGRLILLILLILFVPVLIAAWALELTPDGIKLEKQVDRSASVTSSTGRKLNAMTIGILGLAVVVLLVDKLYLSEQTTPPVESGIDKSIAVLPFADLSQGQDQEWFADGLAEEILNALARAPDLLVASRTSAFAYKGSDKDLRVIASELNVAHILEGSVRRTEHRLRVTAQLIRASDGFHLWSENYDRDTDDIIAVQEDLALKIASAMQTTMDPEALKQMLSSGTQSVAAYQAYLRGLALQAVATADADGDSLQRSYELFEEARRIDANFSAAHQEAGEFWYVQSDPTRTLSGLTDTSRDEIRSNYFARIDAAIETASNPIDRKNLEAVKAFNELRLRRAHSLLDEYLLHRPNDLAAWSFYMDTATYLSDNAALMNGLEHVRRGGMNNVDAALVYLNHAYRIIDPSVAADYGLEASRRWPENRSLLYQVHRTLMWARRPQEAAVIMQEMDIVFGRDKLVHARQACMEGRGEEVLQILQDMQKERNGEVGNQAWLLHLLLDDKKSAEKELRYYEENADLSVLANWLTYHKFDPAPFPTLVALLKREGVTRPAPVAMPYTCPVNDKG